MWELCREHARSRRYAHPLAVIISDIDRLKLVNDGFGRAAGDEVLRAFHARVSRVLRAFDRIARIAGDQFVVALPETDLAGAAVVAERICAVMSSRPISAQASVFGATVSVGYSAVTNPSELARITCEDLLRAAHGQLCMAVARGRNRVCGIEAQPVHHTGSQTARHRAMTKVPAPEHLTLLEYGASKDAGRDIPPHWASGEASGGKHTRKS